MIPLMNFLTAIFAFMGCFGFCFIFHLRGVSCILASLGGAMGWLVFLCLGFLQNDILQSFLATVAVAVYTEILARIAKKPATCYLIIGVLPLVPGGGIYYTMYYFLSEDIERFLCTGLQTLGVAGALAAGVLIIISVSRLIMTLKKRARPCL